MVLIYPDLSPQLVGKGKGMIDFTLCCQAVSVSLRLFASSLCTCSTWHLAFVALSMSLNLNTKYNSIIITIPRTQHYNCLFIVWFNCINSENICYDFYLSPAVTSFQTRLDSYSACSTIGRTCFLNIGMRFTSTNTSVF